MDGKENAGGSYDAAQTGLLKLMLKLPSVRGRLQILAGHSPPLLELCEAYGEATETLEKLERGLMIAQDGILEEYRATCAEIEADVIELCLSNHFPRSK